MKFDLNIHAGHNFTRLTAGCTVTITTDTVGLSKLKHGRGGSSTSKPPAADVTWLKFVDDMNDVLFGLAFHCEDNTVVAYQRPSNGKVEHRTTYPDVRRMFGPSSKNDKAKIVLKYDGHFFEIYINGNYLAKYKKSLDGSPQRISYDASKDMSPLFGKQIHVEVSYPAKKSG